MSAYCGAEGCTRERRTTRSLLTRSACSSRKNSSTADILRRSCNRRASQWFPGIGWTPLFRGLRGVAGLELSLTLLVTAEFIAVPHYRALQGATNSPVLKMICRRILEDEAAHLRFQSSMLGRVSFGRNQLLQKLISGLHWLFLFATMFVVWIEYQLLFEAAGYNFRRFLQETLSEFIAWDRALRALAMLHQEVGADESAPAAVER